ncbi:MAG: tetratricopeptide repeat protein [Spirochaetaceae bacterium]|jgi:tetratricopeptide (TPR) repeat protein|nr:tetratricopeptide repeat protein [Spirochaetaceae bacterium]
MDENSGSGAQKAYTLLKSSDVRYPETLIQAESLLEEALKEDFKNREVIFTLKCLKWWDEKLKELEKVKGRKDNYDRGAYILSQWQPFYLFLDRIAGEDDAGNAGAGQDASLYALRRYIYGIALDCLKDVLGSSSNTEDPNLLLQVGRCYKGLGNYEQALKYLKQAVQFKREDGQALSEMGDVCALIDEAEAAKLYFREAFFVDPEGVNLRNMESELIVRLRDKLAEMGYSGMELNEWLPVYGAVFGVFNVRRKLKPGELQDLKGRIFTLENDYQMRGDKDATLKPCLINHLLWLKDYYEGLEGGQFSSDEAGRLIDETMLKIKIYEPSIYERIVPPRK